MLSVCKLPAEERGGGPADESDNLRDSGCRLELILDRTVFFPEGGGQSSDIGWICIAGNGNGSISQEEATNYLDGRKDLDLETKAYLWQMLCTGSKSKNNPYSTTMGESCWEYMQTVSKP